MFLGKAWCILLKETYVENKESKLIWLLKSVNEALLIQARFESMCSVLRLLKTPEPYRHNKGWLADQIVPLSFLFLFVYFISEPCSLSHHLIFSPFCFPLAFFLFLFLCIYSGWKVICFSFQIPRMGAISQTWAVNLGRSAQRSPRNRFENWNQNSLTTTIWHGLDVTKSLSTLTSRRDKYVSLFSHVSNRHNTGTSTGFENISSLDGYKKRLTSLNVN